MKCLSCSNGHPAGFGGPSLPDFPGSPPEVFSSQLPLLPPALMVQVHPLTAEILWLQKLTGENCAVLLSAQLLDAELLPVPSFLQLSIPFYFLPIPFFCCLSLFFFFSIPSFILPIPFLCPVSFISFVLFFLIPFVGFWFFGFWCLSGFFIFYPIFSSFRPRCCGFSLLYLLLFLFIISLFGYRCRPGAF